MRPAAVARRPEIDPDDRHIDLGHARALAGGVAVGVVGVLAGFPAAATTKLSQKAAGYQDKPMGKARCDNCALWQSPQDCKLVQGPISPKGWCNLYSAKS